MRVSSLQTFTGAFAGIEERQRELTRQQNQLGTGLRVNSPGDDPVAAAQGELARSRLAALAQDKRTTQLAGGLLATAEGALGQSVDLLQSVRETLVGAANGAYTLSERQVLAGQLRTAREQLVGLANTSDGAGGFVFGGQGADAQPLAGGSAPSYGPVAGVQRIGEDGRYAATVDGRAAFMALPQGNGVFVTASAGANTGNGWINPGSVTQPVQLTGHSYQITIGGAPGSLVYSVSDLTAGTTLVSNAAFTDGGAIDIDGQRVNVSGTPAAGDTFQIGPAGQASVFQTLDSAIALLESPTATTSSYAEGLQRAQAGLDGALDRMILMRSQVGDEINVVQNAQSQGETQTLAVTGRQSGLRDLDYAQTISAMQSNQTGLEAALKSYATIARTSLFQLIN